MPGAPERSLRSPETGAARYPGYSDGPVAPPAPQRRAPRPGTGTVFVDQVDEDAWTAVWQAGNAAEDFQGPEAEVLAWARSRPAREHLIFSAEQNRHVPLAT